MKKEEECGSQKTKGAKQAQVGSKPAPTTATPPWQPYFKPRDSGGQGGSFYCSAFHAYASKTNAKPLTEVDIRPGGEPVSYTHLRAHETGAYL
eukprot:2861314-Pyramimonas_sp.AAC.1